MNAAPEHGSDEWAHDVCNALNAVSLNIAVAQRLIVEGNAARAHMYLEQAMDACHRSHLLVKPRFGSD